MYFTSLEIPQTEISVEFERIKDVDCQLLLLLLEWNSARLNLDQHLSLSVDFNRGLLVFHLIASIYNIITSSKTQGYVLYAGWL